MLKLHHAPNSRAGRILWLLEELKLPYEINSMKFHPSDLKSDTHRQRHPLGRIPVLEDGEVCIYESGAIVEYILARYASGKLKPEVSSKLFPLFLQWFHYCEGMVMPPMNTIVVQTIILPEERRNPEILGQAQRLLAKVLIPVNESLEGKEYLIGDFTAADIMLGHSLYMSKKLKCVNDELLNILNYLSRIEDRPCFQKAVNYNV
ncbi:MAG TPA: glutathione S-transferase family protein [Alphaproteobacteria bacterium]|nr:glutathione S-transferase family protein [Alphaproteobacteria bacterium]